LLRVEPPTLCRRSKRRKAHLLVHQGGQRNETRRPRDTGQDEAVEVVDHRARENLSKGTVVAGISSLHRAKVPLALPLEDDDGRIPETAQDEIESQPPSATIAVDERVNALELVVNLRGQFRQQVTGLHPRGDSRHEGHPFIQCGGHERPTRWSHPALEGTDLMASEASRGFLIGGIGMRGHLPHRRHGEVVDVPHLLHSDELPALPLGLLNGLPVHPCGGIAVTLHLHVLPQRLRADGTALLEKGLHFAENEGVPLQRGRVMCLEVPDVSPDVLGLLGRRQPPEAGAQLSHLKLEACVHGGPSRASSRHPHPSVCSP